MFVKSKQFAVNIKPKVNTNYIEILNDIFFYNNKKCQNDTLYETEKVKTCMF